MEFFGSLFSNDERREQSSSEEPSSSGPDPNPDQSRSMWSVGVLFKTLTTKSESVMESYRQDFEDLGSELRKETSQIRRVASRAVKDLPESLEVGASIAQDSLESVGQAIDDIGLTVWKSTAELISHGRDTIFSSSENNDYTSDRRVGHAGRGDGKPYSRREIQLRAVQSDKGTYCREPDDPEEYRKWSVGFVLDSKRDEMENLMRQNEVIKKIYGEVVPGEVGHEVFWFRYFYKVHRLQRAEEARAKLVRRAYMEEEEENLSWDFADEEENEPGDDTLTDQVSKDHPTEIDNEDENDSDDLVLVDKTNTGESGTFRKSFSYEIVSFKVQKDSGKLVLDGGDNSEASSKDGELTVISSTPSFPDDDHGWDAIETIGSNDDVRAKDIESDKLDLCKPLTAAEDEDLGWDIEDDEAIVRR